MKALSSAIFAKCAVGTALHSSIGGRLCKGRAPEAAEYPYVVFSLVSDVPADTFKSNLEDVNIQFSIFSSASSSGEAEDIFTNLKALYDDCSLTISGNTLIWMKRENAQLMPEEHTVPGGLQDVWHYAVDYSVMMEKT